MQNNHEKSFSLGGPTRRQFWSGIALISIIPILTFCYLQTHEQIEPTTLNALSVITYFLIFTIGVIGYLLLRQHPVQIETLRSRLEETLKKEVPGQGIKEAHPDDVAAIEKYLSVMIRELETRMGPAEQEKMRLRQKLIEAQKIESLSALATGMSHDFNNLMAAVIGNINIVMRSLPEGPTREHAHQAEVVSMRAVELANQLLLYTGRGRLDPQPLDFSAVIRDIADSWGAAVPRGTTVELRLADGLPLITADRSQISQAITNLVINAAESYVGKPGHVVVSTGSLHADRAYLAQSYLDMNLPDDTYVYVEVTDQGEGMTQDVRFRMFDPFFSTKLRGRGMGLSVVLGVARAHFAAIKIDSEPGKGTTFRLLFQSSHVVISAL